MPPPPAKCCPGRPPSLALPAATDRTFWTLFSLTLKLIKFEVITKFMKFEIHDYLFVYLFIIKSYTKYTAEEVFRLMFLCTSHHKSSASYARRFRLKGAARCTCFCFARSTRCGRWVGTGYRLLLMTSGSRTCWLDDISPGSVIRRPGNRWAYVCDLPSETGTPLTLLSIESENGHTSMALFIKRGVPFLIFHAFPGLYRARQRWRWCYARPV